jgi:hypothetical protein
MAVAGQDRRQALHWEADYIGAGAFNGFDEADGVFLGGVGSGFVQDVDSLEVVLDSGGAQGAEPDLRDLDECGDGACGAALDPYSGEDLVGPAGQGGEHFAGGVEGGGLAQWLAVQSYEGIGGNHARVGMQGGYGGALAAGVQEDGLAHGEVRREGFLDGGGDYLEMVPGGGKQLPAARGGGGEDERGHGREGFKFRFKFKFKWGGLRRG